MKNTVKNSYRIVSLILFTAISFASCKKDKNLIPDLTLEKTSVEVFTEEDVMVQISGGDGTYTASLSANGIAGAEIAGKSLKVTGISKGSSTITVKDGSGKTVSLNVIVKSAIIDANTPRFKWTNTIELEKANGWGTSILSDRLAISSLVDKKQYVLSWTGGYTVGDKTNGKLRILENGKTAEEITLTALEIQKAESKLFSIVFNKDAQKGEVVFTK